LHYFNWWPLSVASIICIGKTNWCLKTKLHTSLLQVRKDRQVINCNAQVIHHLHHFFIGGSHIPSHHINQYHRSHTNIIIMYHIDLIPSIVMLSRSNQQMLMPYQYSYTLININTITVYNNHSTLKLMHNMVNSNHSTHQFHLMQLIIYRSYSISYRSYSCTLEYFNDYVICSFHWLIYSEDNIDMKMIAT
jgi:hypothetical protein